jgi:hypothetical protein
MRWLLFLFLLAMTSFAHADTRAQFAAKLAQVKPGMTTDQVKKLLGAPDDIKTEKDPGGITAARTTEIWRYGAVGHLKVATRGSVHMQADNKVQYVFGGRGKPFTAMSEAELRRLMQLLANVPSYNDTLEPLALVRAVNALHALGKDRALEVVEEYLRVSSWLDDPGREGVFLVMRVLFDVPPAGMPAMMVGAASPAPDAKLYPRHPIVMIDDLPLKIVNGYALAGEAQDPESDVAAFRKVGTLRAKPLAPSGTSLDALEALFATPAAKPLDKAYLIDQALRFFGTVYRPANRTPDTWLPDLKWWTPHRAAVKTMKPVWNAKSQQLVRPDGSTLPIEQRGHKRVWWDLGLKGTTKSRVTFERLTDDLVNVELRLEMSGSVKADVVRLVDPKTNAELGKVELQAVTGGGFVSGTRLSLRKGASIRPELASGARGPVLTP